MTTKETQKLIENYKRDHSPMTQPYFNEFQLEYIERVMQGPLRARIAELEKENGLLKDKLWALSNPARYAAGYRREL